jgi:hypothetical protein
MSPHIRPVASTPDRRSALREAHRAREQVRAQCYRAQKTERAVREALLATTANLDELGDVDALIVEFRASKITDAAQGGSTPDLKLPAYLEQRRRARDTAREEVAAAKVAHDRAHAELTEAERALQRAELKVSTAAAEVLLADRAIKLADELRTAWSDLWRLTDELSAYSSAWFTGIDGPHAAQMPPGIVGLLQRIAGFDNRQFAGGTNRELARSRELWLAWYRSLLADADAAMPEDITMVTAA